MLKNVLDLICSGRAKFIGSEDTDNTDVLNELLNHQTVINKGTKLEVYFNANGVESGLATGYSRFFEAVEDITFAEFLAKVEKESGLSYPDDQIQFLGSGNAEVDTEFESIREEIAVA